MYIQAAECCLHLHTSPMLEGLRKLVPTKTGRWSITQARCSIHLQTFAKVTEATMVQTQAGRYLQKVTVESY